MKKWNKTYISLLICLMLASGVFAAVTPTTPAADTYLNNGADPTNYNFQATTTTADPSINVYLNSVWLGQVPCIGGTCTGDLNLFGQIDNPYTVSYADSDLIRMNATGAIVIDTTNPTTTDFNFQATDYIVAFTSDCADTNLDTEIGLFDDAVLGWTPFTSGEDLNIIYGVGPGLVDFLGNCTDLAGNYLETGITQYTLPASPPVLLDVFDLPDEITDICADTYPCGPIAIDGGGNPIDVIYKLVFDKSAEITLTLDGGAPVGPSSQQTEHIIAIYSLMEGTHALTIDASDGVNSQIYTINFDITNTGTVGDTVITVEPPITPPPVKDITLISSAQIGSNPYPGGTATINYTFVVTGSDLTTYSFLTADSGFDTPIVVTCDTNPAETMNIAVFDGSFVGSVTCQGTGDINIGLTYSVLVEYPITTSASGNLAGTFGFGVI